MTKKLLNKHLIKIKVITWKQFQNEDLKEYYIPYRNDVINRKDIRSKFVSMFNIKLKIFPQKLNDFLIKEMISIVSNLNCLKICCMAHKT